MRQHEMRDIHSPEFKSALQLIEATRLTVKLTPQNVESNLQ